MIDPKSRGAVNRIMKMDKLTKSGIKYGIFSIGRQLVRTTSAEILRKPKGGKTYIRRDAAGRRRRHVASAPGETHANLTGKTRRSLSFRASSNQLEFGYGVQKGDAPDRAEWLEYGSSRMKARPSLKNGIDADQRNFQNFFDREIGKRLEGRGGFR